MLGLHVSKTSKIDGKTNKTIEDAIEKNIELYNITAAQIFTSGPRTLTLNKINFTSVKEICDEQKINISVHGCYPSVGIWNNPTTKYLSHLEDMIHSVKSIGGWGFVLHLPKKPPGDIIRVLEIIASMPEFNDKNIPSLILEMPASKPGKDTYETPDKLNNLCHLIEINKDLKNLNWCFCIDTAHQYSCGVDFEKTWDEWINALKKYTRDRIKLIHLNGISPEHFNTGKDIHQIIMSPNDGIWGVLMEDVIQFINNNKEKIISEGIWAHLNEKEKNIIKQSSLASIVNFCKRKNIPMILEINTADPVYAKIAFDVLHHLIN